MWISSTFPNGNSLTSSGLPKSFNSAFSPPPEEEVIADRDDLVIKAMKIVRDTQRASASMLQRRLRIGYPRAARLVDELEEMGVVGPSQGGGREREVLISPDDPIPGTPEYDMDEDEEDV